MQVNVANNPNASQDSPITVTMTLGEWNNILCAIHFSRCATGCDPDKEFSALIEFKETMQKAVWA